MAEQDPLAQARIAENLSRLRERGFEPEVQDPNIFGIPRRSRLGKVIGGLGEAAELSARTVTEMTPQRLGQVGADYLLTELPESNVAPGGSAPGKPEPAAQAAAAMREGQQAFVQDRPIAADATPNRATLTGTGDFGVTPGLRAGAVESAPNWYQPGMMTRTQLETDAGARAGIQSRYRAGLADIELAEENRRKSRLAPWEMEKEQLTQAAERAELEALGKDPFARERLEAGGRVAAARAPYEAQQAMGQARLKEQQDVLQEIERSVDAELANDVEYQRRLRADPTSAAKVRDLLIQQRSQKWQDFFDRAYGRVTVRGGNEFGG